MATEPPNGLLAGLASIASVTSPLEVTIHMMSGEVFTNLILAGEISPSDQTIAAQFASGFGPAGTLVIMTDRISAIFYPARIQPE